MATHALAPTAESAPDDWKRLNPLALAGVAFGAIATLYSARGVLPIMGIVFSTIALVNFDEKTEKMRWMASFGMGLSILVALLAFR